MRIIDLSAKQSRTGPHSIELSAPDYACIGFSAAHILIGRKQSVALPTAAVRFILDARTCETPVLEALTLSLAALDPFFCRNRFARVICSS